MLLSEYIDDHLEKDVHDIIYIDEYGNELEVNCDHIDMNNVNSVKYLKIVLITIDRKEWFISVFYCFFFEFCISSYIIKVSCIYGGIINGTNSNQI